MIKRTPRQLPPLADMLRDLGASIQDASRALQVAPSTLYRWHNTGAPRAAALGLYWMTSWGVSELVEDAIWRARTAERLADAQARELAKLRAHLLKLGELGEFGSANDPMEHVPRVFGLDGAGGDRPTLKIEHAAMIADDQRPRVRTAKR